jgi:hypothetical protein
LRPTRKAPASEAIGGANLAGFWIKVQCETSHNGAYFTTEAGKPNLSVSVQNEALRL